MFKDKLKKILKNKKSRQIYWFIKKNVILEKEILKETEFLNIFDNVILKERIYCIFNDLKDRPKCYCGHSVSFNIHKIEYKEYCSKKCQNVSPKKNKLISEKLKNNKEYGKLISEKLKNKSKEEWDIIIKKRKQTKQNKYNDENYNNINKAKETNLKRYGVEYSTQSKLMKNKSKQTKQNKYNDENYNNREKFKQTNLKRYSVENPLQNKEIINKQQQTNLKKYGFISPSKNKEIIKKTINTHNKKYDGILYGSEKISRKIKQTNFKKYGKEYYQSSEDFKKNFFYKVYNKLVNSDKFKNSIIPLFSIDEYKGVNYKYKFKCKRCNKIFFDHLNNGRIPRCNNCFPLTFRQNSIVEQEIKHWLIDLSVNIEENKRYYYDKSKFFELDIYIPSKNIGIELNGIYWHSELLGKDRNYHLNKTLFFKEKGIQVIHIWETEWNNDQEIVKSLIKSKLGLIENKIFARKCIIKEIPPKISNDFLFENHLQGEDNASIRIGLFYEDKLVSLLTIGKTRYNNNYEYEIYRFCNKINIRVVGGFSKLLKYFERVYKPTSILTYADYRYSVGDLYKKNNFELINLSKPNYFYFKSNYLESRIKYQKHKLKSKLEIFDNNLTEWENMQLNGYNRVWDCGNLVFIK